MKLGTIRNGSRDGALALVSRDLLWALVIEQGIARHMQDALERWEAVSPLLERLYKELNAGVNSNAVPFVDCIWESPLPRSYQWADCSAYVNHVVLVRKARGAEIPDDFWVDPLIYQGGSDYFLGPTDDIVVLDEGWGLDFEGEVAVITDDVPVNVDEESALTHIKLITLVNDISLRNLIPAEIAKGFGFFQSKPASAFSPVAVTPDELGEAWVGGKVHLPLVTKLNGKLFGRPNAGTDMVFNFGKLIAHGAKTRELRAGTILGSGTVSNEDMAVGSSCLAEARMREILEYGEAKTSFLREGDHVYMEMCDKESRSIFGPISQKVVRRK